MTSNPSPHAVPGFTILARYARTLVGTMLCWSLIATPTQVMAQAPAQTPTPSTPTASNTVTSPHPALGSSPTLLGKRMDGQAFNLNSLKGKVVLVFFWTTNCPVCRDKMPELRENYAGWRNQAFELVTVSLDARRKDIDDYEQIMSVMVPMPQRFIQLWAGEPGYRDNLVDATGKPVNRTSHLPSAYLIDKAGKVVETYTGRIPAAAWDRIADLL